MYVVVFIGGGHNIFLNLYRIIKAPFLSHLIQVSACLSIVLCLMIVVYLYLYAYDKRRSNNKHDLMV